MKNRHGKSTSEAPASIAQQRSDLLHVLQSRLIPLYRESRGQLILGLPPLAASAPVMVADHQRLARSVINADRKNSTAEPYADIRGMKPLRFPRIAFVFEGEADLRVGITQAMRQQNAALPASLSYQVASLPAGYAIVFPSGVPLDTVSFPHWFRPQPESAASRIFWLVILPDGLLVHTCETEGALHLRSAELFAKEPSLLFLIEKVIEELQARHVRYEVVVQSCLLTLLALVERALLNERVFFHPTESPLSDSEGNAAFASATATQNAFHRACGYIETHIQEDLTPGLIARHASVSTTHLNRIFREAGSTSVMRYVAAQRAAAARLLLLETQLAVNEVASIVGIPDRAIFNRVFKRHTGTTPTAYRRTGAECK